MILNILNFWNGTEGESEQNSTLIAISLKTGIFIQKCKYTHITVFLNWDDIGMIFQYTLINKTYENRGDTTWTCDLLHPMQAL